MAISRRLATLYVAVAISLAITSSAFLVWMNTLTIDNLSAHRVYLYITKVLFENDYLNITLRNIDWNPKTLSSVIINQTFTLHIVLVHEPIPAGEIRSFRVTFNWASGYMYQIKLETTDNFEKHGCNTFSTIAP